MLCAAMVAVPIREANALGILEIIKAAVTKVIKAVDLQIQRQQNKVIWLQNAQKTLENAMSKLKLQEISDWSEKQREQYARYFEELRKVKLLITYYSRIKDITETQTRLVQEYRWAWSMLQQDSRFTTEEIEYMAQVYTGILNETVNNVDQLIVIVNSFQTQMSDGKRLELINTVGDRVDTNLNDLRLFNQENALLSLQRARSKHEQEAVKQMYGIDE